VRCWWSASISSSTLVLLEWEWYRFDSSRRYKSSVRGEFVMVHEENLTKLRVVGIDGLFLDNRPTNVTTIYSWSSFLIYF
jgi:hypothetical protein